MVHNKVKPTFTGMICNPRRKRANFFSEIIFSLKEMLCLPIPIRESITTYLLGSLESGIPFRIESGVYFHPGLSKMNRKGHDPVPSKVRGQCAGGLNYPQQQR